MTAPQSPKAMDKANELVRTVLPASARTAVGLAQPTQVRRPWRSTARTVFQLVISLATVVPFVVTGVYGDSQDYPIIVGQVLAVSAAITRVMAVPQVETFLRSIPGLSLLAAAPKPDNDGSL